MIYKSNFWRHISLLIHILIVYPLLLYIAYTFIGWNIFSRESLLIILILLIVDVVPAILIHLQYSYFSWKKELHVDTDRRKMTIKDKQSIQVVDFGQISSITCYSSYGANTNLYSFSYHKYCQIQFKDGSKSIITNLVVPDVTNLLPELVTMEPIRKHRIYPFIL
jgi:hypothetical protein